MDPDQHCSGSELFVTLIVFLKQGLHRPGKDLEFYLGPGKLLEFEICRGIVLEFCKIILENMSLSLKNPFRFMGCAKTPVKIAKNRVKIARYTLMSQVQLAFYSIQFVQ